MEIATIQAAASSKRSDLPDWHPQGNCIVRIGGGWGGWIHPIAGNVVRVSSGGVSRLFAVFVRFRRGLAMASFPTAAIVVLLSLCLRCADAAVDTVYNMRTSDRELVERKVQCYQDIDNGLWGDACKASQIDKENCALACVSSSCYDSVYGSDPLEEGEIDLKRGRQFKSCIRKISKAKRITKVKGASTY